MALLQMGKNAEAWKLERLQSKLNVHSWPTVMMAYMFANIMHNCLSCIYCDRIILFPQARGDTKMNHVQNSAQWMTTWLQKVAIINTSVSRGSLYYCSCHERHLFIACVLSFVFFFQVFLLFESVLFTQKAWFELCFCCNVIVIMILSEVFIVTEVTRLISASCIHYHVVMRPFPDFLAPAALQALAATCCFTFCMSSPATLFSSLLTLLVCDWLNDISCIHLDFSIWYRVLNSCTSLKS